MAHRADSRLYSHIHLARCMPQQLELFPEVPVLPLGAWVAELELLFQDLEVAMGSCESVIGKIQKVKQDAKTRNYAPTNYRVV